MDFSNLGDLLGQMKDAYEDGINAMSDINDVVAEDMDPTHQIEVDINLEGNAEGHQYMVDAELVFLIDLETMIQAADSPMGDLTSMLGQLGGGYWRRNGCSCGATFSTQGSRNFK